MAAMQWTDEFAEEREMFRELNTSEVQTFIDWANDNYVPGEEVKSFWHPACRRRCHEINAAYAANPGLQDIAIEIRHV